MLRSTKTHLLVVRSLFVGTASLFWAIGPHHVSAQTFESGSTGADGALVLTTPGVIDFDPRDLGLNPDGDHIFHFTSINIGSGVVVKLTDRHFSGPVYWLASGDVTIDGTLNLDGEDGLVGSDYQTPGSRRPAIPGAGGYPGGIGRFGLDHPPEPGAGPGGGEGALRLLTEDQRCCYSDNGGGAGHFTEGDAFGHIRGGKAYGNNFLVPLIGGSGGGGGTGNGFIVAGHRVGGGGGAGGGAILIASSSSITVNGLITAQGGYGSNDGPGRGTPGAGGGGSSGAIRLVADTIQGTGAINAPDARNGWGTGFAPGRVRFEASDIRFTGTVNPAPSVSSPSRLFLPVRKPPKLVALTVNDNPVASDPTGSFEFPDVTIDGGHAAVIIIGASDVLPGTVVRVHVNSENAPDQVVNSEPLTGSQESSTATVTLDLPPGFSRGSLRAVWTE